MIFFPRTKLSAMFEIFVWLEIICVGWMFVLLGTSIQKIYLEKNKIWSIEWDHK